jgi:hypothetical protein
MIWLVFEENQTARSKEAISKVEERKGGTLPNNGR